MVLIHGALVAEAYAPLCREPALNSRYQLVRYHRRGYAGSSPVRAPFSIGQQAADCRALLEYLGIEHAHVVGHSGGGVIALRLTLDAPEVVHSLILLEPALLDVPSGALLLQALEPVLERYGAGEKEGAADSFLRWAIGPDYRAWLDRLIPGAFQQLVADADPFFGVELPSYKEWFFTREDARRITQPVLGVLGAESASIWPGWNEVQERLREWLPQTEPLCSRVRTTRYRRGTPAVPPRPSRRSSSATPCACPPEPAMLAHAHRHSPSDEREISIFPLTLTLR